MKTNVKRICIILLCMVLLTSMIAVAATNASYAVETNEVVEEKFFSTATIYDDFDDGSVLVTLDKLHSKSNKVHKSEFFYKSRNNNIESIEDLTKVDGNIYAKKFLDAEDFNQILKLNLREKSKQNVLNVVKDLENIDGIISVEPSYEMQLTALPEASTGTRYSNLWGLHGENGINVEKAWETTMGSRKVKVGVIDSGIANHPDLNANLVSGWDFINNNSVTNDDALGHGTHVAGTIGATGKNANGVVGVSPNVQLVPLQVFGSSITTNEHCIVSAIQWAGNNDVDILNLSIGGYSATNALKTAVKNYQGLMVCASGNGANDGTAGYNADSIKHYPSEYSRDQAFSNRVISVGNLTEYGEAAFTSNYGAKSVSIFAPGEWILSTSNNGVGYRTLSGTSMAAPHVAGAAALLFSIYEQKPNNMGTTDKAIAVKSALSNTRQMPVLEGKCRTNGTLDISKAINNLRIERDVFNDFGYQGSTYYWRGQLDMLIAKSHEYTINDSNMIEFSNGVNFSLIVKNIKSANAGAVIDGKINYEIKNSAGEVIARNVNPAVVKVSLVNIVSIYNHTFTYRNEDLPDDIYTVTMTSVCQRASWTDTDTLSFKFAVKSPPLFPEGCVADGSMITLADGTQKAVEDLTEDENLLTWNMETGKFESAPILFIDSDPAKLYEVIKLQFLDGTEVKVIDEHAFWDFDLNQYVYIRRDAEKYIGHWFNKQSRDKDGNLTWTKVQLTSVDIVNEYTSAWSPVTYKNLCYYVNGMLSMPGNTQGLINIFDVDGQTMQYDQDAYRADIENYGLFTYEEFNAAVPISEEIFEAFNGKYLKVAIGKGLVTWEELIALLERYGELFNI